MPIDGGNDCIVIDDFLAEPDALVEFACSVADDFELQDVGYPGVLLDVPPAATADLLRFVRGPMGEHFGYLRGGVRMDCYLSMITKPPETLSSLQRLCHTDPQPDGARRNFAGLVYLFDNADLGGTGFYRWTERAHIEKATALELESPGSATTYLQEHFEMFRAPPRYMNGSNDVAELLLEVPPRYNRLIFYPGDQPHSAHVPQPDLISPDFARGRLTLNCFASVRPR